jgi:hypothetical protein
MTIHPLSFPSTSRWAEFTAARTAETKTREPKPVEQTERLDGGAEGPRRSPLFNTIKAALTELVAGTASTDAAPGTSAPQDAAAVEGDADSDAIDQTLSEFARALMHALREGRGPHGEGRGHHHGHAYGLHRHGWESPAQRLEALAQQLAPAAAAEPVEPPVPAPADVPVEAPVPAPVPSAATGLPVEPADAVAGTETVESAPPATTAVDEPPAPQNLHVTIDLGLAESPWKAVHDDLIESFDALRRAIGGPETEREESLEEQLSELLVALAVKLQANELHTAALAPAGSLLSVVA